MKNANTLMDELRKEKNLPEYLFEGKIKNYELL